MSSDDKPTGGTSAVVAVGLAGLSRTGVARAQASFANAGAGRRSRRALEPVHHCRYRKEMEPGTDEWEKGTYNLGVAILCLPWAIVLAFWSEWTAAVILTLIAVLSFLWGLHLLRADDD